MHQPNIRLYLILSGILVVILVAVFIIPLGRRGVNQPPGETVPTPTSVATAQIDEHGSTVATVDFTGVAEVDLFFQAEDGIRDLTVTGVQTCALTISRV